MIKNLTTHFCCLLFCRFSNSWRERLRKYSTAEDARPHFIITITKSFWRQRIFKKWSEMETWLAIWSSVCAIHGIIYKNVIQQSSEPNLLHWHVKLWKTGQEIFETVVKCNKAAKKLHTSREVLSGRPRHLLRSVKKKCSAVSCSLSVE